MTTIAAADMDDRLMTIDDLKEKLAIGDVLHGEPMSLVGDNLKFHLPLGWNVGLKDLPGTEVTGATLTAGGVERQLTKDAILAVTSKIGITREYVAKTPAKMIEDHLNYWVNHTETSIKALYGEDKKGEKAPILAVTKPTITPFSNMELLDRGLTSLTKHYGVSEADLRVDYKMHHDLRRTSFRVIVPDHARKIASARAGGNTDLWSTGVQYLNSLVGEHPLTIQGYLFAWWCTNGAISTHASSGKYNRKQQGQDPDEVYAWAQQSVDDILGGLEHELDAVEDMTTETIDPDDIGTVLADIFTDYKIPLRARENILQSMIEVDDLSMYGVLNAITQSANIDGVEDHMRTAIMEVGGDLPRKTSSRCTQCHRLSVN